MKLFLFFAKGLFVNEILIVLFWLSQVLDAPSLQDDFYLNVVDWSSQNVLAVGLGTCVYLWSASNSKVSVQPLTFMHRCYLVGWRYWTVSLWWFRWRSYVTWGLMIACVRFSGHVRVHIYLLVQVTVKFRCVVNFQSVVVGSFDWLHLKLVNGWFCVVAGLGWNTVQESPNNGRSSNENWCLGMELEDLILREQRQKHPPTWYPSPERLCQQARGTQIWSLRAEMVSWW